MKIHIDFGDGILDGLKRLERKIDNMAETLQAYKDALDAVDKETTRIGDLIAELVAKLAAGGLTAEEEATVLEGLKNAGARLAAVGADVNNPVP